MAKRLLTSTGKVMALDAKLDTDPDRRACVRRLSRQAMAVLDYDRIWSGPMGEIATQAAVVRGIETLLRSGEHDEQRIIHHVLETVCGGRLTSALRAKIAPSIVKGDACFQPNPRSAD